MADEKGQVSEKLHLDVFPGESDLLSARAQARWILALLILGCTLRAIRYLLRFPLWEDEAMLSTHFIDRGYLALLQPMHYTQVAPALFLWWQLTVVKLFGYTEYTLRLTPFLCGLGSLLLFRHVAGRLLRGTTLVVAVGMFAVSYPLTRYAAEAKPYGCDVFLALAMLAMVIEWIRRPESRGWLWGLAAIVVPAVGFSYPAMFVAGTISAVVGYFLCFRQRPGWRPWITFNVLLAASVLVVIVASRSAVGEANGKILDASWSDRFPPMSHLSQLPGWLLSMHAGGMLGYPVGGPNWGSTLPALCFLAGAVIVAWRRQWLLFSLLLAPMGLNFVAGAMHRYPYGGHSRLQLFLAPAFCILISVGIMAAITWLDQRRRRVAAEAPPEVGTVASMPRGRVRVQPIHIVLGLFVLLAAGSLLRDLIQPYKSGTTLRAREFARWFWTDVAHDCELVSVETDLNVKTTLAMSPCGWSSLYFCNQRIYSPRHVRCEPPNMKLVASDHPLRCVVYRSPREERDSPPPNPHVLNQWLQRTCSQYQLVSYDKYPSPVYDKSDRRQLDPEYDYIEVYKFVPKGSASTAALPGNVSQFLR